MSYPPGAEFDSRAPWNARIVEYGRRTFSRQFEDSDGEMVSIFGQVDYQVTPNGFEVENIQYWPLNEGVWDSVIDFVYTKLLI